jgi:flavin reductase (DIM6/NTAB) family NADH-FMN oxidoreductase RutF
MTNSENKFQVIHPGDIKENIFTLLDDDWMLITAGNKESFNTMTASWGAAGILWNKPVAICFIRPQRHTFSFMEKSDFYTLCFFSEKERSILDYCGSTSGRDTDKIKDTGLKPLFTQNGAIYYEQARLVLECRKLYSARLEEDNFLVKKIISANYPVKDFHKFYIGEIVKVHKSSSPQVLESSQ